MDLTNIISLKNLLKAYGAWPNKDLGQHFLIDRSVVERILEAADLTPEDVVLEVGPGSGIMTKELSKKAKKVIAVEIDPKMAEILNTTCLQCRNLEIIRQDVRRFSPASLGRYKVVANLPYYITSLILRKFLEERNKPTSMTLLVQREVAERICAKPGRMSLLSVAVQFYGAPELYDLVPPSSFFPAPRVHSAILKIKVFKEPLFEDVRINTFFRLVKAGFGEKRKMLGNSMAGGLGITKEEAETLLKKAEVQPMYRAERLSLQDWYRVYKVFSQYLRLEPPGEKSQDFSDW